MTNPKQKTRKASEATVTGKTRLSDDMLRLHLNAPSLLGRELEQTDHYIKLLFVPETADYSWPFDMAEVRENKPRDQQPVTRTYTLRRYDTTTGDIDVDFVIHGDTGLAAPWARDVEEGATIGFMGPGGKWHPEQGYEHYVFAGDESAAPAIAAGLEALPAGTTATAYVEIEGEGDTFEMPSGENFTVQWVPRAGATHGTELSRVVREAGVDQSKKTSWFVHGVAEMIKELRRYLFVDNEVDKADVSISGYWRLGMTEDQWQSSKLEFNAAIEEDEAAQRAQRG